MTPGRPRSCGLFPSPSPLFWPGSGWNQPVPAAHPPGHAHLTRRPTPDAADPTPQPATTPETADNTPTRTAAHHAAAPSATASHYEAHTRSPQDTPDHPPATDPDTETDAAPALATTAPPDPTTHPTPDKTRLPSRPPNPRRPLGREPSSPPNHRSLLLQTTSRHRQPLSLAHRRAGHHPPPPGTPRVRRVGRTPAGVRGARQAARPAADGPRRRCAPAGWPSAPAGPGRGRPCGRPAPSAARTP